MMIDKPVTDRGIFVPLLKSDLIRAQKLAQYQPTRAKSKQVYLNTLAVSAVNNYLQILGIATDLQASNSQNPVVCLGEDIADLKIVDKGFLECRPLEPNELNCYVPEAVKFERIAYVVVEINLAQNRASLLGFSPTVANSYLELDCLQNMADLPVYLDRSSRPLVNLSQWLENNIFEADWLRVESVLDSQPQFAFRLELVQRCKKIKFLEHNCSLILIVSLQKQENEIDILVEFRPEKEPYLPQNITAILLDSEAEKVMEARSKPENKKIQFQFSGEKGDKFSIELVKDEVTVRENFII